MKKWPIYLIALFAFIGCNFYFISRLSTDFKIYKQEIYPVSLHLLGEKAIELIGTSDINNDGNKEIILSRSFSPVEHQIQVYDVSKEQDILLPGKISLPKNYHFLDACCSSKPPRCRFRFLDCIGDGVILKEITLPWKIEKEIPFQSQSKGFDRNVSGFNTPILEDLDGDGKEELLIKLLTHYHRVPRGILCYNPQTGVLLWEYYMGAFPHYIDCGDLDGDGDREIVLSTVGINNGAEMNGTSDINSYVIVLDHHGNETWKKEIASWYTTAQSVIVDLDRDSISEIVTVTSCHQANYNKRGRIYVFDGKTGRVKNKHFVSDVSFSTPFAWECAQKETRILVGDSSGYLWVMDKHLKLVKKIEINHESPVRILNKSPENNHWPHLVVLTLNDICVYDWELNQKYVKSQQFNFIKTHPSGLFFVETVTGSINDRNYMYIIRDKFYKLAERRQPASSVFAGLVTGDFFRSLLILLIFNISWFLFVWWVKNLIPSRSLNSGSHFLESLQEIAQQFKNPISTILWTAEKIKRSGKQTGLQLPNRQLKKLADFILDDVKILRQHTAKIQKLIQQQISHSPGQTGSPEIHSTPDRRK